MSPFRELATVVRRCMDEMGIPTTVLPEAVEVPLSSGKRIVLPIEQQPPLPEAERDIMEVFWALDPKRPLRGPELARAAGMSLSLAKRLLPRLVGDGHLKHHKAVGYYLPGTPLGPAEPPRPA